MALCRVVRVRCTVVPCPHKMGARLAAVAAKRRRRRSGLLVRFGVVYVFGSLDQQSRHLSSYRLVTALVLAVGLVAYRGGERNRTDRRRTLRNSQRSTCLVGPATTPVSWNQVKAELRHPGQYGRSRHLFQRQRWTDPTSHGLLGGELFRGHGSAERFSRSEHDLRGYGRSVRLTAAVQSLAHRSELARL